MVKHARTSFKALDKDDVCAEPVISNDGSIKQTTFDHFLVNEDECFMVGKTKNQPTRLSYSLRH